MQDEIFLAACCRRGYLDRVDFEEYGKHAPSVRDLEAYSWYLTGYCLAQKRGLGFRPLNS